MIETQYPIVEANGELGNTELVEARVLTREVFAEVPPRVDYRLTSQGRSLLEGVMAFDAYLKRFGAPGPDD